LRFLSSNLQHNYMEFEIRVGGEFSETMPPSHKDCLETSLVAKCSIYRYVFGNKLEYLNVPAYSFSGKFFRHYHL
jgi:hypothetical protein